MLDFWVYLGNGKEGRQHNMLASTAADIATST